MSNILGNLNKFTKGLVHIRFQLGLEQFVNIYVKFKGGTGRGHTLSLVIFCHSQGLGIGFPNIAPGMPKAISFIKEMSIFAASPDF